MKPMPYNGFVVKRPLMWRCLGLLLIMLVTLSGCGRGKVSGNKDTFAGHWQGIARDSEGHEVAFAAKVIAKGKGKYQILILDDFEDTRKPMHVLDGVLKNGKYVYAADNGKYTGEGELDGYTFTAYYKGPVDGSFEMYSLEM